VSWLKGGLLSPANGGGARFRQGIIPGLLGLAFLFLYVIDTSFDSPRTDVPAALLPFVALCAICIVLVTPDWLHSSRSSVNRSVAFYRAQFPKLYIQERYNLSAGDAREKWLDVLRLWKDESHANHFYYTALLRARYNCRMVFYGQRVLAWLSGLYLLALLALVVVNWGGVEPPGFYSFDNTGLSAARIVFPLLLLGGYLYLRAANMPDADRPTGVWLQWKAINDTLKAWWDENEGSADSG
jgi:hypothetical protein